MGTVKAALQLKCPRCGEGNQFKSTNPYKKGEMFEMNTHCGNCGLRFERESGFFYGAMYMSYMLNIGLFVIATVAWYLGVDEMLDWKIFIFGYVALTVLLVPIIYRFSRSIWLLIMVNYEPEKRGER